MYVNLFKIKKYLIYCFLFLFFNSIFINSLNADPVLQGTPYNAAGKFTFPYGLTFNKKLNQEAELMFSYNF